MENASRVRKHILGEAGTLKKSAPVPSQLKKSSVGKSGRATEGTVETPGLMSN